MKNKKVDPDQERAQKQSAEFLKMSNGTKLLGQLRECLAFTRMLALTEAPSGSRIIILFDSGEDHAYNPYQSDLDYCKQLVSEPILSGVPLLGVAETALREQIRKQEDALRDMGVTNI